MYTHLADVPLSSGETLTCGVVLAPDAEWAPRIKPFLAHKQPKWRSHIEAALERPLDALETRFYVGTLGGPVGPLITLVMVAGAQRPAGRVGLLGYVFTAPEQRGKGAYTALMSHQMEDCRRAGFTILTLTTQRDSTAWRIYERFGFRADHPTTSGRMHWYAHPNAEEDWFRPSPVTVQPMVWDDWPALNLTATRVPVDSEREDPPRSWHLHLPSHNTAEGTFSDALPAWAQSLGRRPRERATHALTFRSETGAVAGWLIAVPDRLTLSEALHIDFYLHPHFVQLGAPVLQEALRILPDDRPLTAYVTDPARYRATVLRQAGFAPAGTLPNWLPVEGALLDVHAYLKRR